VADPSASDSVNDGAANNPDLPQDEDHESVGPMFDKNSSGDGEEEEAMRDERDLNAGAMEYAENFEKECRQSLPQMQGVRVAPGSRNWHKKASLHHANSIPFPNAVGFALDLPPVALLLMLLVLVYFDVGMMHESSFDGDGIACPCCDNVAG
jgi:hypothetical protein